MIRRWLDRLRPRLIVEAREVEGPGWPVETATRGELRDVRFRPETPNVRLDGVQAERVDFSGLQFHAFSADGAEFVDCDFSHVSVEWLPFGDGAVFRDCRFDRARIGDFGRVQLDRCQFVDAELTGWFTWEADIVDCRFAGRLQNVVFNGSDSEGKRRNEFRGNDFRDCDLVDVAFRFGIDLDAQLLPEGPEYVRLRDLPTRLRKALRDAGDREREVLELIAAIYANESDLFKKRGDLAELADEPAVGRRVVELLERA